MVMTRYKAVVPYELMTFHFILKFSGVASDLQINPSKVWAVSHQIWKPYGRYCT